MVCKVSACETDRIAFYERPDLRLEEMRGSAAVTERRPVKGWPPSMDGGSYIGRRMASIE